jgi:methionyl aminopeptidase
MIYIRSAEEIEKIRLSNRLNYRTLMMLAREIRPGVTTRHLDQLAEDYIRSHGGLPAFKGYNGFPATLCTSIDEEVVHGIPSNRVLQEGEIIGIDIGVELDGYFGDAACTYPVGEVDPTKRKLMQVTRESLMKGIENAVAGQHLSDIGHAVQSHVEAHGFSVVRALVGHGIGRSLHEAPEVPNYGKPGQGPILKVGMCLAIEPMVNVGTYEVMSLSDGWTIVTLDGKPSAHFEYTIAISENNPLIMDDSE